MSLNYGIIGLSERDKKMKNNVLFAAIAVVSPLGVIAAGLYGDTPDKKHAWSVHDWNRPKPVKVEPASKCGGAPSDAVVLFDGTKESFEKNWMTRNGEKPKWVVQNGAFCCPVGWKAGEILTRENFGDCQLHIEFRHDPNNLFSDKGPQMRGNSGVFIMDNYEIQVLESYGTNRDNLTVDNYTDGQAGSVYAENPPMVNPQRKAGEWQVYDIVFHQPVWKGSELLHPGSVTVFFNGVLVQDHWEMEGLTTHCVRRALEPHAAKLPLRLQDHGCYVEFRNVWYRPIPSRWDNKTHSTMSGDENEVMAERRKTAETLFNKIKNPAAGDAQTLIALAEVIAYANEGKYAKAFNAALEAYRKNRGDDKEVAWVNKNLNVLIRNKVISADSLIK
jgi:hypothetical protein